MGGNALKHVGVSRQEKPVYDKTVASVMEGLAHVLPTSRYKPIVAYHEKSSFGDADILLSSSQLGPHWVEELQAHFNPQEWLPNGNVHSFDHQGLQIDLIVVPDASFDFAFDYFSYNDLGNLIGRIAHKMGFKYGHLGLFAPLRDGTHQYAEIPITTDSQKAMAFLGFDYQRHQKGFETLNDVFDFAISTPYCHRDIYLLMNRNAKSRIRDSKRPTYNLFLKWIENRPDADKYVWTNVDSEKQAKKDFFLAEACRSFPDFSERLSKAQEKLADQREIKDFWNGTRVSELTGFQGQELGMFMSHCSKQQGFHEMTKTKNEQALTDFLNERKSEFLKNPIKNQQKKTP